MYLPSRMQGSGCLLRIFARLRVWSKTHDFETCNLVRAAQASRCRQGLTGPFGLIAHSRVLVQSPRQILGVMKNFAFKGKYKTFVS
jgi:hypothetical protein